MPPLMVLCPKIVFSTFYFILLGQCMQSDSSNGGNYRQRLKILVDLKEPCVNDPVLPPQPRLGKEIVVELGRPTVRVVSSLAKGL